MKDEGGRMNSAAALRADSSFILHPSSFRHGFTLTEILIVIALIVLIIALAVPAFNLITGTRSVDAAENLVSAMLSRARAEAIRTNRVAGVAFFREQDSERTGMALVVSAAERGSTSPEASGLEQYKAWKEFEEDGATAVQYAVGDIVVALTPVAGQTPAKNGTQLYTCIAAHPSAAATKPPNATYWDTINNQEFDTLVGYDHTYLPAGVGAQTINDPDPTNTGAQRDRYLRNGLILFGSEGQLLHRQYVVTRPAMTDPDLTHLWTLFFGDHTDPSNPHSHAGNLAAYPLFSQLGVVLYENEPFKTAGGTEDDPTNDNAAYNNGIEPTEEQWLDQNCLSLMINRYNGTLVRGE